MILVNADWIAKIELEDLPDALQNIVLRAESELPGVDRALALRIAMLVGAELGGQCYPVPKVDSAIAKLRRRMVIADLRCKDYRTIAREYGLSEKRVREIEHEDRRARAGARQATFL